MSCDAFSGHSGSADLLWGCLAGSSIWTKTLKYDGVCQLRNLFPEDKRTGGEFEHFQWNLMGIYLSGSNGYASALLGCKLLKCICIAHNMLHSDRWVCTRVGDFFPVYIQKQEVAQTRNSKTWGSCYTEMTSTVTVTIKVTASPLCNANISYVQ